MVSPAPLDDYVVVEGDHWNHTKSQSSPTSDGDIGFGNGETFSSQRSRTLNNRTGGSSSHGDGPHGDELVGSDVSEEVFSVIGEKNTAEQGEPDLLSADFGTLDDRLELQQGEEKLTDNSPEHLASDQALPSSGDEGGETDVTKKSTTDKSYVPSSGYGSPGPTGKRKPANSMRGLSKINTRSRTRLEEIGEESFTPMNLTQAKSVRAGGAKDSKKKTPTASHKRVAKKPFGSGESGLEPNIANSKPPRKFDASRLRWSRSESPGGLSSASLNRQQYTVCEDVASRATTEKAPDMSIYDFEGSPEPAKPAPRKTPAKGRSKKRTAPAPAPAPTTTDQTQSEEKTPNRKSQAPAGPKIQTKPQVNKKLKPLQTYGPAVAEEVGDESSPEKTTIPNSKRRRSRANQETTNRPLKKLKDEDDTNVSSFRDEQASSASRKVHIMSSDDGEGVTGHGGTLNLRPNPDFPRMQIKVLSPAELRKSAQDESTQRFTTHGPMQRVSAEGHSPSKPAVDSGQQQNEAPRSFAELRDKGAPLLLQVVSHLPKSCHHSSLSNTTSFKPISKVSESESFPRIGLGIWDLDRSNRVTPLFSGQNEQCLEALSASTAGQRDNRQSSPYSLHPRSMAFQQELSSMQAAQEKEQSVSKKTDRIQPLAAKGPNSSLTEAHNARLEGKNPWQAAVDETSQGLADTMHSITNTVLRELTSKEASIDSIVQEYSRNGAIIAANNFRRQHEEHERAVAQFEPSCTKLSRAFSCATVDSMEMQTELSSKMCWLRQLVTTRRHHHGEIMAIDSANSANRGVD